MGYSLAVEHLPGIHETLGFICSRIKKEKGKKAEKIYSTPKIFIYADPDVESTSDYRLLIYFKEIWKDLSACFFVCLPISA